MRAPVQWFAAAVLPVAAAALVGCGNDGGQASTAAPSVSATPAGTSPDPLPDIDTFRAHPSGRFIVDADVVDGGHPFLGSGAARPHSGAHVLFGRDWETWPRGGDSPANFPPIYSPVDGTVVRRDATMKVGSNDRYGLVIEFARNADGPIGFDFSIEPMVPEPAPGFYAGFLNVDVGDRVKAGDVIAWMYLPREANGTHIHFDLVHTDTWTFMAPAIFSPEVMAAFAARWGDFGFDGTTRIDPTCMGWKVSAGENPFGDGESACLAP